MQRSSKPAGIPVHKLTVGGLDRVAAHELTDRHGGLADRFEHVYQIHPRITLCFLDWRYPSQT